MPCHATQSVVYPLRAVIFNLDALTGHRMRRPPRGVNAAFAAHGLDINEWASTSPGTQFRASPTSASVSSPEPSASAALSTESDRALTRYLFQASHFTSKDQA